MQHWQIIRIQEIAFFNVLRHKRTIQWLSGFVPRGTLQDQIHDEINSSGQCPCATPFAVEFCRLTNRSGQRKGYSTEYLPRSRYRYTLAGTRFSPKQLWLGSRLTATFVSSQPPPSRLDLPSNGASTPTPTPQPLRIYRRGGSSRSSSFDISINRLDYFAQI